MRLLNVDCYNCGSDRNVLFDEENGYKLVKCDNCGLLFVNPRPAEEDISKAKLRGIHEGVNVIATTGRYAKRKVTRYVRILSDLYPDNELRKKETTWFDIGCGYGEFLEAMEIFGNNQVKVKGSELNEIKIASAKKRNLDVDFYDLDSLHEEFDALSLLNVFSHLPDPVSFLSDLKRLLKPGGSLIIETGHTSHLPKEIQIKPYYLPDHLSFANQEIIESILKRVGFKIEKTIIYRSTLYPHIYNLYEVVLEFMKIILHKHGSIRNFFPRSPNRDMFIRCKLE